MEKRSHRFPKKGEYVDSTKYNKKDQTLDIGYQLLREVPAKYDYSMISTLFVDYNKITSLPEMPRLIKLSCKGNCLIDLPYFPSIRHCNVANNMIKRLPPQYTSSKLEWLDISGNGFKLNVTLPRCTNLYITDNNLQTINLGYVPHIKYLDLSNNVLRTLSDCSTLLELHAKNNKLDTIGRYDSVQHLDVSNNRLTVLHDYPSLVTLNVEGNNLTEINQPTIDSLIAKGNKLTKYHCPRRLEYLDLSNNMVQDITLSSRVVSAYIDNNPLKQISGHYDSLQEISLEYSTYRIIYESIKNKIVNVDSLMVKSRLRPLFGSNIAVYEAIADCTLGKHEEQLRRVAKIMNKSLSDVKARYYKSLVLTITLSSSTKI